MNGSTSMLYPFLVCAGVSMGSYLGGLFVGLKNPVAEPVPVKIIKPVSRPVIQDGYLACTTPNLLYKGIVDNVQCMGTSDLLQYPVLKVTLHSDKTAEVQFDLKDDTTAILWVMQDAVGAAK